MRPAHSPYLAEPTSPRWHTIFPAGKPIARLKALLNRSPCYVHGRCALLGAWKQVFRARDLSSVVALLDSGPTGIGMYGRRDAKTGRKLPFRLELLSERCAGRPAVYCCRCSVLGGRGRVGRVSSSAASRNLLCWHVRSRPFQASVVNLQRRSDLGSDPHFHRCIGFLSRTPAHTEVHADLILLS